jgi:hypothetical protein
MLQLFLKFTDKFLYNTIQNAFRDTENAFRRKHLNFDIKEELKKFEDEPLGCVIGIHSKFETKLKLSIKLVIGFFFVLVPIIVFSGVFYLANINILFAIFTTLVVSMLASSRLETLSKNYVDYRVAQFS